MGPFLASPYPSTAQILNHKLSSSLRKAAFCKAFKASERKGNIL